MKSASIKGKARWRGFHIGSPDHALTVNFTRERAQPASSIFSSEAPESFFHQH